MKRVVGLILAVVVVLCLASVTAFSENVDFSTYSNDELVSFYNKLKDEMLSRGIARSGDLEAGMYVVGVDIAEGSYNVSSADGHAVYYFVYESQELYEEYLDLSSRMDITTDNRLIGSDNTAKIDLKNGQILNIMYSPMHLEEVLNTLMP